MVWSESFGVLFTICRYADIQLVPLGLEGVIDDGPRRNPFSVFGGANSKDAVKARVDVMR